MSCLEDLIVRIQSVLRRFIGYGGIADVYLAWDNMGMTRMAVIIFAGSSDTTGFSLICLPERRFC